MPMHSPSHPGRIIRTTIEEIGVSITEAARTLGVSRQTLDKLVNERGGVTHEMALRLEAVFGSTADHWIRMQSAHDLAEARSRATEITSGLRRLETASTPR